MLSCTVRERDDLCRTSGLQYSLVACHIGASKYEDHPRASCDVEVTLKALPCRLINPRYCELQVNELTLQGMSKAHGQLQGSAMCALDHQQ